jgi:hypothetical protein
MITYVVLTGISDFYMDPNSLNVLNEGHAAGMYVCVYPCVCVCVFLCVCVCVCAYREKHTYCEKRIYVLNEIVNVQTFGSRSMASSGVSLTL